MNRSTALAIAALAIATVGCSATTPGLDATGSASRIAVLAALAATAAREAMEAAVSARLVTESLRRTIEDYRPGLIALRNKYKAALDTSIAAWGKYGTANTADCEDALEQFNTAKTKADAARAKWELLALIFRTAKDVLVKAESLQTTAEQAAEAASKAEVAARLIAEGSKVDSKAEAPKHDEAAGNAAHEAAKHADTAKAAANKAFTLAMQNSEAVRAAFEKYNDATSGSKPRARPD